MKPQDSSFKKDLAARITKHHEAVTQWHRELTARAPAPFYCSVDLRDSGHKIVPVDCNLYPAGFNNLCPEDLRTSPPFFKAELEAIATRLRRSAPRHVLVLPESHTTNQNYIENLWHLTEILSNAGFDIRIGWFGPPPEGNGPVRLVSTSGKELFAHPIQIEGSVLSAGGFVPDLVLLNNDFSSGYPSVLDPVAQPIVPSYTVGWHSRRKSEHFRHYNELARQFAELIGIDPWAIQVDTEAVEPVDFNEEIGVEPTAQAVERVLDRTARAYEAHGIIQKPFAFIKNNSGTYGMGIMVVHSADELRHMNRRTKNKMSVGKNRSQISSVVVQEGVPTATLVDRLPAEPVVYLLGGELIGGFLRTNTEKGAEENLNSAGMVFRKLCMSDLRTAENDSPLELVYGAIARISALASGLELAAAARAPQPPSQELRLV